MHMMRPLLQQVQRLPHVVCRPDSRARVATGLLQKTQGVVGTHHISADSSQTPGGGNDAELSKSVVRATQELCAAAQVPRSLKIKTIKMWSTIA